MYFELKAEVFTKHGCSTKNQEEIIKKCVDTTVRLSDVPHPK